MGASGSGETGPPPPPPPPRRPGVRRVVGRLARVDARRRVVRFIAIVDVVARGRRGIVRVIILAGVCILNFFCFF